MVLWIKVNVYANWYLATPFGEVQNKANERAIKNKTSHELLLTFLCRKTRKGNKLRLQLEAANVLCG